MRLDRKFTYLFLIIFYDFANTCVPSWILLAYSCATMLQRPHKMYDKMKRFILLLFYFDYIHLLHIYFTFNAIQINNLRWQFT